MTLAGDMEAQQIETLIRRWADAVHAGDLDRVGEDHADDIVMSDVPPQGAEFDITELDVAAGNDVAFVWKLFRCGTPDELANDPANRLRLTIGLRKPDGRWFVTHEHHSFPNRD